MTPERWRQIEENFQAAADCATAERVAVLDQACAADLDLRREVESLLAAQAGEQGTFMAALLLESASSLAATHEEDLTGRRVGAYRVTGLIGEGGMGAVYRAVRDDDQYHKEVAIKLVKPGLDTAFVLRRFRYERQILAKLEHPYVARLLEGGTTADGRPYFVMEHVAGQPITDYCVQEQLPLPERLKLFRAICEAVQYAHQNLIIHRDLKPSNILVTADGVPKLLDFGIAKLLDPEFIPEAATQTVTALRAMTPDYASPEQVRGEQVTTATDIYSLGVVLYELLTGQRPHRFENFSAGEIERVICKTEPRKPSAAVEPTTAAAAKLRKQLAGDLDNIVLQALCKEPARRYQSAEQFSEDIRRHLAGLPVCARQDTLTYRTGKFVRRHKLGVAATLVVILSLVGGIVATSYQARRAERRFQQVRKLANTFLFNIHDEIQNLPGSTKAREMVVTTALEYLDSLAQEAAGDPTLARELAVAYQKVGDVQGDPYAANLGHAEAAMKSYQKSLSLAEQLAARNGGNLEVRRTLAQNYFKLGTVISETGNKLGAQATMRQGVGPAEALAEQPGEDKDLVLVINYYMRIGNTQLDTGDVAGALGTYRHLQLLSERRAARYPSNRAKMAVAFAHSNVGEARVALGDLTGAIESYRQSLVILEALAQKEPSNLGYRRGVMIGYLWLGHLSANPRFFNLGDRAAALGYYRKALPIAEGLAVTDAKNVFPRSDLAGAYLDIADILTEDDPAQAADIYRRALAITRSLLEAEPDDFRFLRRQAFCLRGLAAPLERMGDRQGAHQHLRQALETFEKLAARDPADVKMHAELQATLNALGDFALRAGDTADAQEHYRRAVAIGEAAVAATPSYLYSQWRLADSYLRFGQLHAKLATGSGRPKAERAANQREACAWHQKTLALWDRWSQQAVSSPFNTSRRDQAARALAQCEAALTALGN